MLLYKKLESGVDQNFNMMYMFINIDLKLKILEYVYSLESICWIYYLNYIYGC